jgi:hypothetical protein
MNNLLALVAALAGLLGGVLQLVAEVVEVKQRGRTSTTVTNTIAALVIILGAVGSFATSNVIVRSPELITSVISNVYFTPAWFIIALGLFWLRGYLPRSYGLAEVFVGMTAVFYAIKSDPADLPPKLLALASGIYIIVRGLDNFEKGLPPETRTTWRRIFWNAQGTV